jgi:hypothetical protein
MTSLCPFASVRGEGRWVKAHWGSVSKPGLRQLESCLAIEEL